MTEDLERWPVEFKTQWASHRAGTRDAEAACPEEGVRRLADPDPEDIIWLTAAMAEHHQVLGDEVLLAWSRMLVIDALSRATSIGEALFQPLIDAGIDEVDPSENRWFIEPCVRAFGHRRVNEYLLEVLSTGTDARKAGAANAMYWARVPVEFHRNSRLHSLDPDVPESRESREALSDIWDRQRLAMLVTFVRNENVEVRRSILAQLDLDASKYPEHLRSLVPRAIEIAKTSEDDYIRHRVEVQLGAVIPLQPLPHRPRE